MGVAGTRNEWVKYTNGAEGTPRNNRDPEDASKSFHPTCGDLTLSGKRSHCSCSRPSPWVSGDSWLPSHIHCMPTQIPRNGTPHPIASEIAARKPDPASAAVEAKCPTPGRMIFAAFFTCAGSEVIAHS